MSIWTRLEPRMRSILDRIAVADQNMQNPYLSTFTPRHRPSHVELDGRSYLMMSSYSYLGLSGDNRIIEAASEALHTYGTGTHGVRLLSGSTPPHAKLEAQIAALRGCEDAIVLSSGYVANLGVIAALCGPRDTILADKEDHASIVDGCRLSGAKVKRFRHNDTKHLEEELSKLDATRGICLVVVDGVYSMSGDIAPIPEMKALCTKYNAFLMVDEAHSFGLIGDKGLGIEDHFDDDALIDIKMGTFSKAIPSVGGYVAGPRDLVTFLRHAARPFIFSASLPPAQAAAASAALQIMTEEQWRVKKVQRLGEFLRTELDSIGFDTGPSQTAIIPVMTESDANAFDFAAALRNHGIIANPVVAPAVAPNEARMRVTVTAAHDETDLEKVIAAFKKCGEECGIV